MRKSAHPHLLMFLIVIGISFFYSCDPEAGSGPSGTLAISSPAADEYISRSFDIEGSVSMTSGLFESIEVTVSSDGDELIKETSVMTKRMTDFKFSVPVDLSNSAVGSGLSINVSVYDGTLLITQQDISCNIDEILPSVSFYSPVSAFDIADSVTFSLNLSDDLGIDRIEYWLNPVDVQTKQIDSPVSTAYSGTASLDFGNLAEGSYKLTAKAYDHAGNASAEVTHDFSVTDNQMSITITPLADSNVRSKTLTLTGTATSEYDSIGSIQYAIDSGSFVPLEDSGIVWNNLERRSCSWEKTYTNLTLGFHEFKVRVYSQSGVQYEETSVSFTVQDSLNIEFTNLSDGFASKTFSNDIILYVTKGLNDVESVVLKVGNSPSVITAVDITGTKEYWSVSSVVLNEGITELEATVSDSAGKSVSHKITVYIDTTAPNNPVLVNLTDNLKIFESAFTLQVLAEDNLNGSGIGAVRFNLDSSGNVDMVRNPVTDVWEYDLNLSQMGAHSIVVYSLDKAGTESSSQSLSFSRDDYPQIEFASHDSDLLYHTNQSSVLITGTASDYFSVSRVEYMINGDGNWNLATDVSGNGSFTSWTANISLPTAETVNTVQFRSLDNTGNYSQGNSSLRFYYDLTGPSDPQLIAPSEEAVTTSAEQFQIEWTSTDAYPVKASQIRIGAAGGWQDVSLGISNSFQYTANLNIGLNQYYLKAIDSAGNESGEVLVSITRDTVPTVEIRPVISESAVYTANSSMTIEGICGDNNSVSKVQWRLNGSSVWTDAVIDSVDSSLWSAAVTLQSNSLNVFEVKSIDNNLFESEIDSRVIIHDDIQPSVTVAIQNESAPYEILTTNTSYTVPFSGTVTDNNLDSVQIRIDGGPYQAVSGTENWTFVSPVLGLGAHTADVLAKDSTGQESVETIDFSIVQLVSLTQGIERLDNTSAGSRFWYSINLTAGQEYILSWLEAGDPGMGANINVSLLNDSGNENSFEGGIANLDTDGVDGKVFSVSLGGEYYVLVKQYAGSNTGSFKIKYDINN